MQAKQTFFSRKPVSFQAEAKRTNRRIRLACLLGWTACMLGGAAFLLRFGLIDGLAALVYPASMMQEQETPIQEPNVSVAFETPSQGTVEIISHETGDNGAVAALAPQEAEQPLVLIYHTHATEAYFPTADAAYAESGRWRTEDPHHSVIAVGELLKELLENEYGINVLHDTTNYEPPKLSTAYSRSLAAMRAYQQQYPSISVFIDVHRDAYGKDVENPKDYLVVDGLETARLMFVVGTGKGATGSGFDGLPDFDANFAFASAITDTLRKTDASLARDVRVKTGRYNQHVSNRCLLVEVGHNANTLEQAMHAVPWLARALAEHITALPHLEAAAAAHLWQPEA